MSTIIISNETKAERKRRIAWRKMQNEAYRASREEEADHQDIQDQLIVPYRPNQSTKNKSL